MNEFAAGIIGVVAGGSFSLAGTFLGARWTSYMGPRKLEEWKEQVIEQTQDGPRKSVLQQALADERWPGGRSLATLCLKTGTDETECRRLLVEIGAEGKKLKAGNEGWALKAAEQQ
jgi:hypothetical protein